MTDARKPAIGKTDFLMFGDNPWTVDGWMLAKELNEGRWSYCAAKGATVVTIHHTGKERLSQEAFRAHVLLGFPAPPRVQTIHGGWGVFAWRNDSIIKAAHAKGVHL